MGRVQRPARRYDSGQTRFQERRKITPVPQNHRYSDRYPYRVDVRGLGHAGVLDGRIHHGDLLPLGFPVFLPGSFDVGNDRDDIHALVGARPRRAVRTHRRDGGRLDSRTHSAYDRLPSGLRYLGACDIYHARRIDGYRRYVDIHVQRESEGAFPRLYSRLFARRIDRTDIQEQDSDVARYREYFK